MSKKAAAKLMNTKWPSGAYSKDETLAYMVESNNRTNELSRPLGARISIAILTTSDAAL